MKITAQFHGVKSVIKQFYKNSNSWYDEGLSFLKQRKHWSERLWWILASLISLCCCGISMHKLWTKWDESPVTMVYNEHEVSISEIPFPAVTICPMTKSSKDKLDLAYAYHELEEFPNNDLTNLEQAQMEALMQICNFYKPINKHFGHKFLNNSIYEVIRDMAPSRNETFAYCQWKGVNSSCTDLFMPVFTEHGLCFSFNMINAMELFTDDMVDEVKIVKNNPNIAHWDPDNGYTSAVHQRNTYPRRVFNSRIDGGLVVFAQLFAEDIEYICSGPVHGFKVILSTPGDSLKRSRQSFRVPLLQQVVVRVRPKVILTSDELRNFEPNQRKCYYSTERKLRFFRIYAQHSCESECLANFTLKECGCVKFSMPRDKYTNFCGAKRYQCFQDAQNRLFGEDVIDGLSDNNAKSFRRQCNCLSNCRKIYYEVDVDKAKLDLDEVFRSYNLTNSRIQKNLEYKESRIYIAYDDYEVMTLKRRALYSQTDFLAACGGLLGLFLGLSALNIIQFIYSFTLRAFCAIRQLKSKNDVAPFHSNHNIESNTIHTINGLDTGN